MSDPLGAPQTRREARERRELTRRRSAISRPSVQGSGSPRTLRARAKPILSFAALVASGALIVAVSVPASAFVSDVSSASAVSDSVHTRSPGQSVQVSAGATAQPTSRDGFQVLTYAQLLQLRYGNSSNTYTTTIGAIRWPFPYVVQITDGFGQRPRVDLGSSQHNGTDFVPGTGTPIYAIADGVVSVHVEEQGGFGNHVMVQHSIPGQNIESLYAHMQYGSSPLVVGDPIKVGDFIGLVGDTGNSYGAHLHLEIHLDKVPIDPYIWLKANAVN